MRESCQTAVPVKRAPVFLASDRYVMKCIIPSLLTSYKQSATSIRDYYNISCPAINTLRPRTHPPHRSYNDKEIRGYLYAG